MTAPKVKDAPDARGGHEETIQIHDVATVSLTGVDRAAIDSQVATAKQYPRSVTTCLREAVELATMDPETAESMFYTLERRDPDGTKKFITGPSVRLAEVLAYAWRNLRADGDIESEDAKFVVAVGTCFDLERNVAFRTRVKRRITTKTGKRYGDDMIGVTANAAVSIAVRNAVVRTIPRVFVDRIYNEARRVALGDAQSMSTKRLNALAWFKGQGISNEQVFEKLGVAGVDDIGEEEYLTLRGLSNAVKQGETTLEDMFRAADTGPVRSAGASELNAAQVPVDDPLADDQQLVKDEQAKGRR
jgi:hypothetical protein